MEKQDIFISDDIYRPDDGNGYPIDVTPSELYMTGANHQFHWYASCKIRFYPNTPNLDTSLSMINHVIDLHSDQSVSLKFVVEISTDNFQNDIHTYTFSHGSGSIDMNTGLYTYSKKYPYDSYHAVDHSNIGPRGYRTGNVISLSNIAIFGVKFWVRIKHQIRINSSNLYVDCKLSDNSVWKTFEMYAPFYQNITPPTHFYGNGINTFNTTIPAKYKFEYSNIKFGKVTMSSYIMRIVRKSDPPYEVNNEETTHLYLCPMFSVSKHSPTTYEFTSILKIEDPTEQGNYLTVAERIVSGDVEYKETDDLSMIGDISWSIVDPTENYETYGVFLRNEADIIQINVSVEARYGAQIRASCGVPGKGSFQYIKMNETSQPVTGNISFKISEIPKSISASYVRMYIVSGDYVILNESTEEQIPIVSYAVPSLPVTTIHRCEADGTPNDNGAYCKIDWSVVIVKISDEHPNSKRLVINHPEGTTDYNPLSSYTQSGQLIVAADTEQTYAIEFILSDDITTITKTLRLSTANVTMDWLYNGKAVSFGKVARTPESVEISETWKLICYKLLVSGVDFETFMKQVLARLDGIEQFASNLDNTGQKQVTFYNGNELLLREWIRGNSVDDPVRSSYPKIDYPTKESTPTTDYSFVGWATQDEQTIDDPAALTGINSYRNIYAAFNPTIRKYTVNFYNGSSLLQTVSDLQYHYSANYTGSTPVNSDGYAFVGWCPSGRVINGNTDAKAVFFDDTEITDDWATIMQAVANGTVNKTYHVGQYKTLDCGSEGQIKVRIKGFMLDRMANSEKKVKVSWEAVECFATARRMNPAYSAGVEGTGSLGGWGKSELRTWLNGDFYNGIDPIVRDQIKTVRKTSYSFDAEGHSVINKETSDKIFIPSAEEVVGHYWTNYTGQSYSVYYTERETDGIDFRYTSNSFSKKKIQGTNTNGYYWLRTAASVGIGDGTTRYDFCYFLDYANVMSDKSEEEYYICIGFCT